MSQYIYIMTNKSFEGHNWVKIGLASNIEKRRRSLSTSGLPYEYEVYAFYEIPENNKLADKQIHSLISKLNPNLRLASNREFFEMTPEDAYQILKAMAVIHNREDKLFYNGVKEKNYSKYNIERKMKDNSSSIPSSDLNGESRVLKRKQVKIYPKIDWMLLQNISHENDKVYIKRFPDEYAILQKDGDVLYKEKKMSLNEWGKLVTKYPTINIYREAILDKANKTLADLREEKMKELRMTI